MPTSRRHISLVRLAITVVVALVLATSWSTRFNTLANDQVDAGLKRALITFASARLLNAVISAVQQTTISVQPFGVGITLSPAQVLDPINDLVEQFGALMLIVSVSFGIQKVLIGFGGLSLVSVGLTLALVAWLVLVWRNTEPPRWLDRTVLVLLLVRFAVPLAALGSEAAYLYAMEREYEANQKAIEFISDDIRATTADLPAWSDSADKSGSFWERLKAGMEKLNVETLKHEVEKFRQNVRDYLERLKAKGENLVRHVITLTALFVVQTVLLPLVFLWLTLRVFRAALSFKPIVIGASAAVNQRGD